MNIDKWWKAHGGAVVGFAGAAGILLTNLAPGAEAQIEPFIQDALVIIGIAGAVLHGYLRTSPGE